MEQRTPEWFAARKGRVTASSVGAILGHDPYRDRDDVMRAMVREWHGAESEFSGNVATEYGTHHEAGALAEYEMETGVTVDPVGFVTREEWAGCSPDGLIGMFGGIEVKCPYGKRKMTESEEFKALDDQPHYYDQVQFSLWVCERAWWDVLQWAPSWAICERVTPDNGWRSRNLPKLRSFWDDYIVERELPHAQTHLEPRRVDLDTPDARMLLAEYDDLSDAIDQATARRKEVLENLVALARHRDATIGDRKLTRIERAGSVSYAKIVKEHLSGLDLDPYRGKPSEYWVVK